MTEVVQTKDWAKGLIEEYRAGASDSEVAAMLNITTKEYYKQLGENQAFASLVDFGRTLSQAFWEGQARKNVNNKGFNTSLWAFYMKNKYGWADKTETLSTEPMNADLDSLRSQVARDVAKFVKQYTPELTDAQRVLKQITREQAQDE